jgi:hypothetical protein
MVMAAHWGCDPAAQDGPPPDLEQLDLRMLGTSVAIGSPIRSTASGKFGSEPPWERDRKAPNPHFENVVFNPHFENVVFFAFICAD